MKIVTCTRPNASTEIDGVEFTETDAGMVSGPVDDDVAERFCRISGYSAADVDTGGEKGDAGKDEGADKKSAVESAPVPRKKMGKQPATS
jgi:hypothetical protein